MKDYTEKELTESRPGVSVEIAIDFCLRKLYEDSTHKLTNFVVDGLTFEELIGALLSAKDNLR